MLTINVNNKSRLSTLAITKLFHSFIFVMLVEWGVTMLSYEKIFRT